MAIVKGVITKNLPEKVNHAALASALGSVAWALEWSDGFGAVTGLRYEYDSDEIELSPEELAAIVSGHRPQKGDAELHAEDLAVKEQTKIDTEYAAERFKALEARVAALELGRK